MREKSSSLTALEPVCSSCVHVGAVKTLSNTGHVKALDGLRAFAIAGVLAVHAGFPGLQAGWLGVDLFFAISGFLITTLLLKEWQSHGTIRLGYFWVRRFLRLMPAYYVYVIFLTAAIWYWPGSVLQAHGGWTPEAYTAALWLYVMNYPPQGGIWNGQGISVHLWSLAVEEQYYLLWPLVLVLFIRFSRWLSIVTWSLAAMVAVYFFIFANSFEQSAMLYGRGLSLFLASATAVFLHQREQKGGLDTLFRFFSFEKLLAIVLLITGGVGAIAAAKLMTEEQLRAYLLPYLIVLYVMLVAGVWYLPIRDGVCKRVLTHPVLLYIGKISYGIYLYHEALRVFVWWATDPVFAGFPKFIAYGIRFGLYLMISILVASVSYHYFETRFLKLKDRFY